jgi:hypothetical protein
VAVCEVCGNDDNQSFEVIAAGARPLRHTFDSFECAIHRMAPVCEHCACKVIGHGTEVGRQCAHEPGSNGQPANPAVAQLAASKASRMSLGMRPRPLTS